MTDTPTLYAIRRKADGELMITPGRRQQYYNGPKTAGKMVWTRPGNAKNACLQHWPIERPGGRGPWDTLKFSEQDVYEIVRVSFKVEEVVS